QNNIPWPNFPLVKRLQDYFSIENVFIVNDVYMATLAEWQVHGGSIEETFVYLTISTGISCAIIDKGSFIRGAGFAGEMGLLPVKAPLHSDAIAGFEKVAAGPAIQKMGQDRQWTTEDVLNFYQKKDPEAIKIMNSRSEEHTSELQSRFDLVCRLLLEKKKKKKKIKQKKTKIK